MTPMHGLIGLAAMLAVMLLLRIPVGFAMGMVGLLGLGFGISWNAALSLAGTELWATFSSYGLTVIPMFVFMGQICFHTRVNERLYRASNAWFGGIPGGLAVTTIAACAGFAAICGSNTATAATMTRVALPEMKRYGYAPVLSSGVLATASTLGVVIPPSVVLVVYGLNTGTSIGKLFMASVLPGVFMAFAFAATAVILCIRRPELAPVGPRRGLREKLASLPDLLDAALLFILVMTGLATGIITPTEAGAAGSLLAVLLSLFRRTLSLESLKRALYETLVISCMIFVILAGAVIFGRFLAVTRLPFATAEWAAGLPVPAWSVLLVMLAIYTVGGCVMDALAFLIITIPVFMPLALRLGFDPVWFGVIVTVVTTMGAVTPPVGISAFVVSGLAEDIPLRTVFRGIAWFLPSYVLTMLLLIAFPSVVLFAAKLAG